MRTLRRSRSLADRLPEPVRLFLARRMREIGGFVLLGLVLFMAAALSTWSVDDPSLNNATDGPVRNWLGRPGAVAADLAMQLMGLASVAALVPLLIFAIALLRGRGIDRAALRFIALILGVAASAAVASALPVTARWPLPTGLGGVMGDALFGGARNIIGLAAGSPLAGLVGFAFAAVAILSLTACAGFGLSDDALPDDEMGAEEEDERPAAMRDDEPGMGVILLGSIAHGFMALKSALVRRMAAGPRLQPAGMAGAIDDAPRKPRSRREPSLDDAQFGHERRMAEDTADAAPWTDQARNDGQEKYEDRHIAHVAERPGSLKQGRRAQKEAQPSFLDNENERFELPALSYLAEPKKSLVAIPKDALEQNATLLEGVLEDFGVRGEITNVRPGPVVTLYELEPAPGTKSSRVISLAEDIARSMSAVSARVAVVSGRNAMGIELPNAKREMVLLRELLASQDFEASKAKLAICLGKTIGGEPVIVDLARMPHLLVAGTTGSGKSVAINTMILSLLYRLKPEECRLIMVDPKMLELSVYDGIPHLLTPVVTDPKKAVVALKWAVREMEERYKKMAKLGVRNIEGFNARVAEAKKSGEVISRAVQTGFDRETGEAIYENETMDLEALPFIVVIVDEMADLMMVAGKEIEGTIQRLAQMARAAGIHVILATQRPSVDVITGTIKANFPTRISFQVTSKIDSRTILGEQGAEQLLGQGDMLYMAGGGRIARVHGPFVSDQEVERVVQHLKTQGRPQYLDAVTTDEANAGEEGDTPVFDHSDGGLGGGDTYEQAVAVVLRDKKASTSYIQRRLQIGYNRAASIMERMEKEGIVGAANHAGKREILVESGHDDEN
ncbi:MAG: DNA translocase FtsK [Bosea sp. (in: a-proteobacteria)]